MQEAVRRGDQDESKRISTELKDLVARRRKEDLDRIKATTDGSVDPVIVEKYLALPPLINSDDEDEEASRGCRSMRYEFRISDNGALGD
jgi:hypothetical protein